MAIDSVTQTRTDVAQTTLDTSTDDQAPHLVRTLGLVDAVSMVVGIILGSGIFVAPATVALLAPNIGMAAALWAVGAVVAGFGALVYAECGARLPLDGGFFVFFERAFGWRWAFVSGWAALLISYPTSLAGVAVLGAQYLGAAFPGWQDWGQAWAIGTIFLAAVLNAVGVTLGRWAQRIMTGAKLLAIFSVLAAAIWAAFGDAPLTPLSAPAKMTGLPQGGVGLLLQALATLMWSYDGWTDITMVAGEVREPSKNLPRAVLLSLFILFAVYATVQIAVMVLLGDQAQGSDQVLALALQRAFGAHGGRILGLLVLLTTLGSIHGVLFATSRLAWAMAEQGAIFGTFAKLVGEQGVPRRAIAGVWAVATAYVLAGSFTELLEVFALIIWLFYGATALALLRLRRAGVGGATFSGLGFNGRLAPAVLLTAAALMTLLQVLDSPVRCCSVLALLGGARLLLNNMQRPQGAQARC